MAVIQLAPGALDDSAAPTSGVKGSPGANSPPSPVTGFVQSSDVLSGATFGPTDKQDEKPAPGIGDTLKSYATKAAIPTAAFIAGAQPGEAAGASVGALGGPLAPVTVPLGTIVGGIVTGAPAAWAASKAQDVALDAVPGVAQKLGIDPATLAAEKEAHPVASVIGEAVPQALTLRPDPGTWIDLVGKNGAGAAGKAAGKVLGGAAVGATVDAAQQYVQTGQIDPTELAVQGAVGSTLTEPWLLHGVVAAPGRAITPDFIQAAGDKALGRHETGQLDATRPVVESTPGLPEPKDLLAPTTPADYSGEGQPDLFGVDAAMSALRQVETGDNPAQISSAGAVGAHQLLPSTAKQMAAKLGMKYDPDRLLNDPDYNGALAQEYLKTLLAHYDGDMFKAITAYHAGPGNVDSWISRFGDPSDIGREAWLQQIAKVGNPKSAQYPVDVYKEMGVGIPPSVEPVSLPETEMPPDLSSVVAQAGIAKVLQGATLDDQGNKLAGADGQVVRLSAKLATKLGNADIEGATDVVQAERGKLEGKLDQLAQQQSDLAAARDEHTDDEHAKYQADLDRSIQPLIAQDRLLGAAQAFVDHIHDQLMGGGPQDLFGQPEPTQASEPQLPPAPTLVTEPGPMQRPLPAEPQPSGAPAAADTRLADQLRGEDFDARLAEANKHSAVEQAERAKQAAPEPQPEPTPSDEDIAALEAQLGRQVMRGRLTAEEARAQLDRVKARATAEPLAADETNHLGVPERVERQASAEPQSQEPEPEAAPAPIPAPEPVPEQVVQRTETNIRTRADERADQLGSSRRSWFLKGVDHEMGVQEVATPPGKKGEWFEEGRKFARDEAAHQERERAARRNVDSSRERPETGTSDSHAEASGGRRSAEPMPKSRGGRRSFLAAIDEAVGRDITEQQASRLRAAEAMRATTDGHDYIAVPTPDLWKMLDAEVSGREEVIPAPFERRLPEATSSAQAADWQSNLRQQLDRLGLHGVGLRVMGSDAFRLGDAVAGGYHPIRKLIDVAFDYDDPKATLDHEAIHALRDLGVFTPEEWNALVDAASADAGLQRWLKDGYTGLSADHQAEELVAEMYARYRQSQRYAPPVARLLSRIAQFVKALYRSFAAAGYRTAQDVMDAITRGEIGARTPSQPGGAAVASRFRKSPAGQTDTRIRTDIEDMAKKAHYAFATPRDLAKMAEPYMPSAKDFLGAVLRGNALGHQFDERLAEIKHAYEQLPLYLKGPRKGSVSDLLDDMTRTQKWAFKPDWVRNALVDPALAKRFDAMPKDAQDVIHAVLRYGHEQLPRLRDALLNALTDNYDRLIAATPDQRAELEADKAKLVARFDRMLDVRSDVPYAPRSRSGDFVGAGWSKEYEAARLAQDAGRLDALRSDPAHYWVRFYDSLGEAKAAVQRATGDDKPFAHGSWLQRDQHSLMDVGAGDMHSAFQALKSKVEAMLRDAPCDEAVQQLNRLTSDLYLSALAESSARKAELKSARVSGKDPVTGEPLDMIKAFVTRGRATNRYIASLGSMPEVQDALQRMHQESERLSGQGDARANAQRFKNELLWHYTNELNRKPSNMVGRLLYANSLWHLMLKPAYYLQIAVQAPQFAIPHLAGEVSYGRAWGELLRGYGETRQLVKSWTGDHMDTRQIKDPALRALADEMIGRGLIGQGRSLELGNWELNGDGALPQAWNNVDRALRQLPTNIEDVNRLSTAIAMYRIAKGKGLSDAAAYDKAEQLILNAFGDYSNFATPKALKSGGELARIPLQYRKFQVIAATNQAKLFYNALKNADLTPDARWVARRAFAFNLAHQVALAGMKGIPGAGLIGSAAMLAMGKPMQDWDFEAKKKLDKMFGAGSPIANFLEHGAPYDLLKTDMGGTLGLDYVFSPLPNMQLPPSEAGRSDYMAIAGELALGGVGTTAWDLVEAKQLMAEGDTYRAMEQLLPSGFANLAKAGQYGDRGLVNRGGDVLLKPDEISFMDKLKVALGLTPSDIAETQDVRGYVSDTLAAFEDRATLLKRRYMNATRTGDTAALAKARQDWMAMNEERRTQGLMPAPLSSLLMSPMAQRRREMMTMDGVPWRLSDVGLVHDLTADDAGLKTQAYSSHAPY